MMTRDEFRALRAKTWIKGKCVKCGLRRAEGQDPCIAGLPGVRNACCGHGVKNGYVQFTTGHVIRGRFDHHEDNQ